MNTKGKTSTARTVEAVSTTTNNAVHPVIIANAEAGQETERNQRVILTEKTWSLRPKWIEDKKDRLNVRCRGMISTIATTEVTIMKAAEGEGPTETTSQDPLVMRNKETGFQRILEGILKMIGEEKEDRRIKFTTTTRYKSTSVLAAMVERITTTETVITIISGSKEEVLEPSTVRTALTQVETGLSMRKSRITIAHQVAGSTKGTTDTTSMILRTRTTLD